VPFLHTIIADCGDWCHVSTDRDSKTISARVKDEGESFFSISLPNFGKDFEKSLDQGYVDRKLFRGFAFQSGLPRLFGGFLDLIFDRTSGVLLDSPSINAIRSIRQITLCTGKVNVECTPERVHAALEGYIKCESDVRNSDKSFHLFSDDFIRIGNMLFRDVFSKIDNMVYNYAVIPKHGPGSTADRVLGNQKYDMLEWTSRLEGVFPMGHYAFPRWGFFLEASPAVNIREPGAEIPVKVITVPKTLKTPRIIAMEPVYMQYMQQSILVPLMEEIENDSLISSFIGFTDQKPNQLLAEKGSRLGTLATLDLSEASDRVSNQHVRALLRRFPHLFEAVDACRSRKASVLGQTLRLAKFASMGSALCFPFEAMVFLTTIFMGIERGLNTPLTREIISSFSGEVRVYGDDIVIPVEFVTHVIGSLEALGFRVNSSKSFWTGKFRESCGKEYYDGEDVSIVRVRHVFPSSREQTTELEGIVSLHNLLFGAGFWATCRWLLPQIERLIPFPAVASTSSVLGRHSFLGYEYSRMHPTLHYPLVKGVVIKDTPKRSELEGSGALMKTFLKQSDLPFADKNHLLFAGRPIARTTSFGWFRPF